MQFSKINFHLANEKVVSLCSKKMIFGILLILSDLNIVFIQSKGDHFYNNTMSVFTSPTLTKTFFNIRCPPEGQAPAKITYIEIDVEAVNLNVIHLFSSRKNEIYFSIFISHFHFRAE